MNKRNKYPGRWLIAGIFGILFFSLKVYSQVSTETIYSKAALYKERTKLKRFIEHNVIEEVFALPLDSTTEYRYEGACATVAQYLVNNEAVQTGITKMLKAYPTLTYDTRRAFLEMLYAIDEKRYISSIQIIIAHESHPKLFAMCAVYLFREDHSFTAMNNLAKLINNKFPVLESRDHIISELLYYLKQHYMLMQQQSPDITLLFAWQQQRAVKTVYSLQRWNRDYRGLAIVQLEDGSFVKHTDGRLMVFEQLARSGSDLPYFITNGSTPQGVYRITGTAVSRSSIIGPTPNLQLLMPYEGNWLDYFSEPLLLPADTMDNHIMDSYLRNFPPEWRGNASIKEVMAAGKVGRTEIIAHGTTIDPEYFVEKPFYPLTPTLGCLCAREQWNITTGRPSFSEQLNLVNAWLSSPANKGLLYVIDIDDQQKPVSRAEVEAWVNAFERKSIP